MCGRRPGDRKPRSGNEQAEQIGFKAIENRRQRQVVPRDKAKTETESDRVSLCTQRGWRGSTKTLVVVSVVC